MSKDMMSELLQECIAAYESGLSPEECLSAYPSHRNELEPLLRQALSLRVAYAAAPQEEFMLSAKDALMFAAGREVSQAFAAQPSERFVAEARHHLMFLAGREAAQAFSAQPDERFVDNARHRLISAAGASAQEALRAVPPPRMPFWWNTRRKLLEAASMPRPQPAPRPFAGGMALRAGLSMAVVVLALAIGGFAYMMGQNPTRSDASELASLQQELNTIEARKDAGQPVSEVQVNSLLQRTTDLAEKLRDKPTAPSAAKLSEFIDRQQSVLENKVYSDTPPPPSVVQAQQQLDDQKTKLLASGQVTPAAAASTSTPPAATSTPGITPTALSTPVLPPPVSNQVRVSVLPDGRGVEIRTATLRFIAPKDWNIGGISTEGASPVVIGNAIAIGGGGAVVFVNTNGVIEANVSNQPPFFLRTVDPTGRVSLITADDLVAKAGPVSQELPFTLRQILASFEMTPVIAPPPPPPVVFTPIPTSTSTPTPAAATPAPTSTPAPATSTPVPAIPTSTPVPATPTRVPSTPAASATP
jgi:hypothetical protein